MATRASQVGLLALVTSLLYMPAANAPSASLSRPMYAAAAPTLLTFQGHVLDSSSQLPQPVVVHVLVKAKRLKTGFCLFRTVLYTQRAALQRDEAFAPTLEDIKVFVEYEEDRKPQEPVVWSSVQFTLLGLFDQQGPYVLELKLPQSVATKQLRLRLLDWPIYYNLDTNKLLSNNLHGEDRKTAGVFRNAVVMTHVHSTDPNTSAKIIATHAMHHMALGFELYLLYTWNADLTDAIMSNKVTAKLVHKGVIQIISMDALQFPTYDDNRADVSHPFHQSYDARKLVVYNHASLTLWGELFHLAVLDVDEYFSTHSGNKSVNSWFRICYPRAHVILLSRVDVVCEKCALAGQTEMAYFSQHWDASNPTAILEDFGRIASFSSDPKSVFWPDKVGQVWLHKPFSLSGSKTVSNADHPSGTLQSQTHQCVDVVHLYNLFKHRVPYDPRAHNHPTLAWVDGHNVT